MVQFVEEDHLECVLALLYEEETDYFRHCVVQDVDDDLEVSVQAFADFADEEGFGFRVVVVSGFL